ncbi:MAG: 30S ribosomal protein S9 [Candidatus Methanosuratincola petrocarbonis]|nr:30S ribosomal protein S9 [Candidatus Methanosuratincola sp.]
MVCAMSEKVVVVSGKRKTAIARAVATKGTGKIYINNTPIEIMTPELVRMKVIEPLLVAGAEYANAIDIDVKVEGGGVMGQAEAARVVIANSLAEIFGESLKGKLMAYDRRMLVEDPRRTEPKKFGGYSARRRKQKSYR